MNQAEAVRRLAADLPRVDVPDMTWFDPMIGSHMHTGDDARRRAIRWDPINGVVAMDTETPSVGDPFRIKCVTASWYEPDGMHTVLLDPIRRPDDHAAVRLLTNRAASIVLHNAPFDIPGLFHAGLITPDGINRVVDTLVMARMAFPDVLQRKSLSALAGSLLGLTELAGGMDIAFKAAGFRNREAGYAGMDIDRPIYRFGAMSDTAVTLALVPHLTQAIYTTSLEHPFSVYGCTSMDQVDERIEWVHTVNRVMLRRNAVGLALDPDYLNDYADRVNQQRDGAEADLESAGIRPGNGLDLVTHLSNVGGLPATWPRTATGRLSATKDNLERLHHPLADAHRLLAHADKILGYLGKCTDKAAVTGRVHPQCQVLGASATGRMSYNEPELQQFPGDARPIIRDDGQGLTSIDWSQIEPVTLGNMANDTMFLDPYERGEDLYDLPMRAAGIDRKTAKVVLLATMYGQGVTSLAERIDASEEGAAQIRRQMLAAMPASAKFMARINTVADAHGKIITAAGRVLPVPVDPKRGRVLAHKAVNYVVQGSAADVLMDAIVRCERAGLGDAIQIPLHDELVVDTPAAPDIRAIMSTPPDFLIRWAGRTPVLRTDAQDMGSAWIKPD